MRTSSLALFWWGSVTGPARLVNEVADMLCRPSNVMLALPANVPWKRNMRDAMIESFKSRPGVQDLTVTDFDGSGVTSPPDALRELALAHLRDGYMSWACDATDYLRDNGILSNRLVWVRNVAREDMAVWEDFCERWSPSKPSQGLLLIETSEDYRGGMPTVEYGLFVTENSVRTLCAALFEDDAFRSLTEDRRRYSTVLVSKLSMGDAEFAERFVSSYRPLSDDPLEALDRMAGNDVRPPRESLSQARSSFLASVHDRGALETCVWEAQVECLFPIIERDRLEIAEMHREALDRIAKSGILNTEYALYKNYREFEIGQIYWLVKTRKLPIDDEGEKEHIKLLRKCRNAIAHRSCIEEPMVRLLIDRQGWRPPNRRYGV